MKKLLAIVLALALALSLALPTAAVNWDEFQITRKLQDITIKNGDSFTLHVEVNVPEGVEVEYKWSYWTDGVDSGYEKPIEGAASPELHVRPGDPFYAQQAVYEKNINTRYTCQVTAYEKDDAGNTRKLSSTAYVRIERSALGKLYDITIMPFTYAFGGTVALIGMTMGIAIPISPVAFLGFLLYGFFDGFRGLFSFLDHFN